MIRLPTRVECLRTYCQDLCTEDVTFLRPWHLPFDASCGLKGMLEPDRDLCQCSFLPCSHRAGSAQEVILQLTQLICVNGSLDFTCQLHLLGYVLEVANRRFQTNANTPGVERLAISASRPDVGLGPRHRLSSQDIAAAQTSTLLNPMDLVCVKGWTRCFCAVTVMVAAFEVPAFLEASSQQDGNAAAVLAVSFGSICRRHGPWSCRSNPIEQFNADRLLCVVCIDLTM